METLLIHKDLIRTPFFESLIDLLRLEKVRLIHPANLSSLVLFERPVLKKKQILIRKNDLKQNFSL